MTVYSRIALGILITLCCVSGCKPGYITETEKFASRVKNVVNPHELQAWATNLLANPPSKTNSGLNYLEEADIPQYIRAIDEKQIPDIDVSADTVQIWYGGGFGHWGLLVGNPSLKKESSQTHYIVEWKPGIYFWSGP